MKFILANGRAPRPRASCTFCCEPIGEGYLRELTTLLSYCNHHCYFGHWEVIPEQSKGEPWHRERLLKWMS
jgi:hypothetical protein